jgi:hypothetical protein
MSEQEKVTKWWQLNEIRYDIMLEEIFKSNGIDKIASLKNEIGKRSKFQMSVYSPDITLEGIKTLVEYHGTIHLRLENILKDMMKIQFYADEGYSVFNLYFYGKPPFYSPRLLGLFIATPNTKENETMIDNLVDDFKKQKIQCEIRYGKKDLEDFAQLFRQKIKDRYLGCNLAKNEKIFMEQQRLMQFVDDTERKHFLICFITWQDIKEPNAFIKEIILPDGRVESYFDKNEHDKDPEGFIEFMEEEVAAKPWRFTKEEGKLKQIPKEEAMRKIKEGEPIMKLPNDVPLEQQKGKVVSEGIRQKCMDEPCSVSVLYVLTKIVQELADKYSRNYKVEMDKLREKPDWDSQIEYADRLKKYAAHKKIAGKMITPVFETAPLTESMKKNLKGLKSNIGES